MGTITVTALNDKIYRKGEVAVLNELYAWREQYFRNIVAADQTQAKYLIGWLRRLKGGDPSGRPGLIEFNEQFIGKKNRLVLFFRTYWVILGTASIIIVILIITGLTLKYREK
jgi:hypothetical protein